MFGGIAMILNHTVDSLLERRAIRAYRPEQISEEELTDILNVTKYAPSSLGMQERHFTIIQSKELIREILDSCEKHGCTYSPGHIPFYDAPTVVVISAPENGNCNREDVACATTYLMLAAHSYGIGTCYIYSTLPGLRDPEIMKKLQIPEGYCPYASISMGYPKDHAPAPKERRRDDVTYLR